MLIIMTVSDPPLQARHVYVLIIMTVSESYRPTRAGERSDESLLLEHWGFALRRHPPPRLAGAKQQQQQQGGLYLTKGVVPQGSVITLYPGTHVPRP